MRAATGRAKHRRWGKQSVAYEAGGQLPNQAKRRAVGLVEVAEGHMAVSEKGHGREVDPLVEALDRVDDGRRREAAEVQHADEAPEDPR